MKILLINRLHYIGGGADRVYLNTGELLKNNNIDVAYFSTKDEKNEKSEFENFFITPVKTRNTSFFNKLNTSIKYLYNSETILKLENLIKVFKPNVAHIHLFYGGLTSSLLSVLRKHKIPIVLTIHDYRLLCPANAMIDNSSNICEKCKGGRFYNCFLKTCSEGNLVQSSILMLEAYLRTYIFDPLDLVDHFIFVSNFSLSKHIEFDRRFQLKSSHLYNFSKSISNVEFTRGKYFLFYGRLSREKGILTLIQAIIQTNYKLIIAGDGPLKEEIIKFTNETGNIKFVGFKDNVELQSLIMGSSFVVVPSEWYENNPMTIIESFLLGKPVIGADIGGITELVNSSRGFLFQHSSIASLLMAINLASNMDDGNYNLISRNSYYFANKNFNELDHFNRLKSIYNKLINA
jgi:glycosyltransferase involved in cell wall biosynthesis